MNESDPVWRHKSAGVECVQALTSLLRKVIDAPGQYAGNTKLIAALRSQGALAKFEDPSQDLRAMSLNHHKKLCNEALGNYEVLDRLRKSAMEALAREAVKAKRGNVKTKDGLLAMNQELEDDRLVLMQDLYILQRAYDLRCVQARAYAQSADLATQARCAKEQKEIDASFSLRRKVVPSEKVSDITKARRGKNA